MANDPKVVATTNAWKDQAVNSAGYREGVDYSLAIKNATSDAEIKQLQEERQAKIDSVYGGKDPYTTPTTNKVTGQATTPTNTASKYYDSDWTPQTATKESNLNYNAQQAVASNTSYGDFLNSVAQTTGDAREAALAWAKAGGSVPYTSGPNAGKDAWSLSSTGYNTNLDSVLGDIGAMEDKLKDEGYLKDGKIVDWEAVNELLNQSALKAQYEGGTFDKIAAANYFLSEYGGGTGGPGTASGTATAPNGAGVQNAINPGSSGSSSNTNININGGNGGNFNGTGNSMYDYLEQWFQNASKQQQNAIDWATSQQIQEVLRTQKDAEAQLQAQRDQIAVDEAKAKDNQALYAETRGDKGGIGASQYDAIMNTAAQNRLTVNQTQTKLATDTANTISNLRAQGEYEKADALLELSQTYLAQLISLEQWSAEYGLSVAQFNEQVKQWERDYQLNYAQIMGATPDGKTTLEYQQYQDSLNLNQQETLAEQGWQALSLGMTPSAAQLKAMGVTSDQVSSYLMSQQVKNAGGSGTNPSSAGTVDIGKAYSEAFLNGGYGWLEQNYKSLGLSTKPSASAYDKWVEENASYDPDAVSWNAKQLAYTMSSDGTAYDSDQMKLLALYRHWSDNPNATEWPANGDWGESKGWMTDDDLAYLRVALGLA